MITYKKIRDVKSPKRGTGVRGDMSAGIDFFIPNYSEDFARTLQRMNPNIESDFTSWTEICVPPHSHILIPSGIIVNLYERAMLAEGDMGMNICMIAFNKSSIGIKQLNVGAQVIDADYTGEIHISLMNTSAFEVLLTYGEKIVQFALVPILNDEMVEIDADTKLFECDTARGSNGFGSTGTK